MVAPAKPQSVEPDGFPPTGPGRKVRIDLDPPQPPEPDASFTDIRGRRWTIELSPPTVARVRNALGLDLEVIARKANGWGYLDLAALACDPERLREVLWAVLCDQAASRGVSKEDFCAAITMLDGFDQPTSRDPFSPDVRRETDIVGRAGTAIVQAAARAWPDSPLAAAIAKRGQ